MNILKVSIAALGLAGATLGIPSAWAAETAPPAETLVASIETTATVTAIDQATRNVTLRNDAGEEMSFVAGDDVKNLAQVKVGDVLRVVYTEALAYEVHKGGTTEAPATAVAGGSAEPGTKPAGMIARQTTGTVVITAIDLQAPSVTFKGPAGNTRTIRIQHPEKLQGVSVGDTVELTFTEALALKVEAAPAK